MAVIKEEAVHFVEKALRVFSNEIYKKAIEIADRSNGIVNKEIIIEALNNISDTKTLECIVIEKKKKLFQ